MSNESRNVLVVTFEDSAEIVKVCVCACMPEHVHVCESLYSCLAHSRVLEELKGFG